MGLIVHTAQPGECKALLRNIYSISMNHLPEDVAYWLVVGFPIYIESFSV